MKKIFLIIFMMIEIVIGIQIFIGGLPTWLNPYISILFLLFVIFNLILLAAFLE